MNRLADYLDVPMPENYLRNNITGAVYNLGQSQSGPALDFASGPVEYMGQKGYRVKGDPFTVMLADGSRLKLGQDVEATQRMQAAALQRQKDAYAIEAARLGNIEKEADIGIKRQTLAAGGDNKPLTEFQGKSANYGARAASASDILENVGQGGKVQPGIIKRIGESMPLIGESLGTMLNPTQSPEQQQVEQAQRDFVNAVLRQESGAAISPSEFANAQKQYFPQPGDSKEVIDQKKANRATAIAGLRVMAGPAARSSGTSGEWSDL